MINVNNLYSVIKGGNKPLSSDCGVIEINNTLYIFDVGANPRIIEELNNINLDRVVIISHFHIDHITNLNKINYSKLYVSDNTFKRTKTGETVKEKLILNEYISIFPITCCHCKGSIGLKFRNYAFIGDSLAPQIKKDCNVYNVQLLKQEINELEKLDVDYFLDSHNMEIIMTKKEVIDKLQNIYNKRQKDNPYIKI